MSDTKPNGADPNPLKIEAAVDPNTVEQTFTIKVSYVPGSEQPPMFQFFPSDGMTPMDCVAMCNQGITWSIEALEMMRQRAPQPNREQRRAANKPKSRIWTPGNA